MPLADKNPTGSFMVGNTYVPLYAHPLHITFTNVDKRSPTHLVIGSLILGWHKYMVCEFAISDTRRSDLKAF
jgi:hypothetical protein